MDDDLFGGYKGKSIVEIDDEQALQLYCGGEDFEADLEEEDLEEDDLEEDDLEEADLEKDHMELMEHCEGDTDVEDLFPLVANVCNLVLSDPGSDGGDEDLCSSDDDGYQAPPFEAPQKRKSRAKRIREQRIWFDESRILSHDQLCEKMCFKDVHQFRRALKSYHIVQSRDYKYLRNDKDRVKVCCVHKTCPFSMLASQIAGEPTVAIRKLVDPHTCGITMDSTRVNSSWLSKVYEEEIRSDPDWKVTALMDDAMRKYGVEVPKMMAYRARRKAAEVVLGNHKQQYLRIRDYLQTVLNHNPGSRCIVTTILNPKPDLNPRFHGLFICLNAQKEGFINGCRPFIGVDGCFVKLTNGAQVLAATGRDGNNNLFPLAFGVVGKEDVASWTWFLTQLKYALGGQGGEHGRWTLMSDRQKGLLHAIKVVFPDCAQRYCKRHLYQNFCTAGFRGGNIKTHMDSACYAYNKHDFDIAMEQLKDESEGAWEWLSKIPTKHWARHAFDTTCKTDLVVNNLSEVFNNYIINVRDKPIVTMQDMIRTKLMSRFHTKREGVATSVWEITPNYAEKLELEKKDARYCRPVCAGMGIWQVTGGKRTYAVNLEARSCGCFKWDLTGVPCKHAVSAIYKSRQHPEDFVHEFFKKPAYERAYINLIYPVPGPHDWAKTDTPDIDPPIFTKHPGRPKKSRRKAADEPSQSSGRARMTTITCSNCHKKGHKYTSCSQMLRPDLQIRKTKHKSHRTMPENFSHEQNHEGLPAGMTRGVATKLNTMRGRSGARGRGRGRTRRVARIMEWLGASGQE